MSANDDNDARDDQPVRRLGMQMIDLGLEEEKAKKRKEDEIQQKKILENQKITFLKMHKKINRLKTMQDRVKFISEQEKKTEKILGVKADCGNHKEFIERMKGFGVEEKFQYQLLILAYNAIDKAEYKEKLAGMTDSKDKSQFVKDCINTFNDYQKLSKEEQAAKSFSFTREEMKKIAFGNAAAQEYNKANKTHYLRFNIPQGYKWKTVAVPLPASVTNSNKSQREGGRELIIVQHPKKDGLCEFPFVRSKYPVRITIPKSWDRNKYENGDVIGVRLKEKGPVMSLDVPPGVRAGDVILIHVDVSSRNS